MTVQQVDVKVELFYDGMWKDITGDVRGQPSEGYGVKIRRGRRDQSRKVEPTSINLTLNNCNGRYSPRNPNSPLFQKIGLNTPIRASVNGQIRGVAEVAEWPMRWDQHGNNVWIPLQAAGILRRLGQDDTPLQSALTREILSVDSRLGLKHYWTFENYPGNGRVADQVGNENLSPRRSGPINFSTNNDVPGGSMPVIQMPTSATESLVEFTSEVEVGSNIRPFAMAFMFSTVEPGWFPVKLDFFGNSGPMDELQVQVNQNAIRFVGLSDTGGTVFDSSVDASPADISNGDFYWLEVYGQSPSIGTAAYVARLVSANGEEVVPHTTFASLSTTGNAIGEISTIRVTNESAAGSEVSIGHVSLWRTEASLDFLVPAIDGFTGEPAGVRIVRLCAEEGVPLKIIGDPSDTPLMGPQTSDTFLDLIRECERVDLGILYESRTELGLVYRTRRSLYNQEPTLKLDYNSCHLRHPLRTTDDDRHIHNDVTVSRVDGSSARAILEIGRLSVQPPPNGVGRYGEAVTVNVANDTQLPDQASWRLNLGTVDEGRFSTIRVRNLAPPSCPLDPNLSAQASAVDLGDKITIINTPLWLPPDMVEQLDQGYEEELDKYKWLISFNTSPASPYTIATVAELGNPQATPSPLTNDSRGNNPTLSATVAPASGSLLLLAAVVAKTAAPAPEPGDFHVLGLGLTWELLASQDYRARRRLYLFRAQSDGTSGSLQFIYNGANSFQEMQWALSEWTNVSTGSNGANAVKGVATAAEETGDNSLTVNISSSVTGGDTPYVAFGVEEAGGPPTLDSNWTALSSLESGNVRHLITGSSNGDDQTPTVSWSSDGNGAAGIGLIVSPAPATAEPMPATPIRIDTDGSALASDFDAGNDTSFAVETTRGTHWGVTGSPNMDFPMDIRVSGARVRVTGVSSPAASVRDSTSGVNSGDPSFLIPAPTLQPGDMIMVIQSDTVRIPGDPSHGPWNVPYFDNFDAVFWKIATDNEPASYRVFKSAAEVTCAAIVSIRNASPAIPITPPPLEVPANTTVPTPDSWVPWLTSVELRWVFTIAPDSNVWTPPAGFTKLEDIAGSGSFAGVAALATRITSGIGSTGVHEFTASETPTFQLTGMTVNILGQQTFNCQKTVVNNVNKLIPTGEPLRLWQPATVGL